MNAFDSPNYHTVPTVYPKTRRKGIIVRIAPGRAHELRQ